MSVFEDPEIVALERRHRDAMLDVVMVWADIDGCLSMLLANARGVTWTEGAADIRKLRGSSKFAEVVRFLKNVEGGDEAARKLRKIKRKYEGYSVLRDLVAHSRCVGVNAASKDHIIFLTFEKVGENRLAMDHVSLQRFLEAKSWADDLLQLLFRWTRARQD